MLRGLFGRAPRRDPEAVARIKAHVRAILGDPDAAVTVSEIQCPDPGCPDLETVILVMRAGTATSAYKIGRALDDMTEQDVRQALVSLSDTDRS